MPFHVFLDMLRFSYIPDEGIVFRFCGKSEGASDFFARFYRDFINEYQSDGYDPVDEDNDYDSFKSLIAPYPDFIWEFFISGIKVIDPYTYVLFSEQP